MPTPEELLNDAYGVRAYLWPCVVLAAGLGTGLLIGFLLWH